MKNIYVAFVLTVCFFVIGIMLGSYVTSAKEAVFYSATQDLFLQTVSAELQYELVSQDPCSFLSASYLDAELTKLENRLSYLESISDIQSDIFSQLRLQYFLLEIRHLLLYERANEACGYDIDVILYFYGDDKSCSECKSQGTVLSAYRKKHGDVRVYSFDVDFDDGAIKTLLRKYNVTSAPTIIYNDEKFSEFMSMDALESLRD